MTDVLQHRAILLDEEEKRMIDIRTNVFCTVYIKLQWIVYTTWPEGKTPELNIYNDFEDR